MAEVRRFAIRPFELHLRHTFRLSRGASDSRRSALVEIEDDEGRVGRGEAAPIARYRQDQASSITALEAMLPRLADLRRFAGTARRLAVPGQSAAEAALDMALWDLAGQRLGAPVYELLGLDPRPLPVTSFTIAMDTPERLVAKVEEAGAFEVLKVKLGSAEDRRLLEAVRGATDRPLRVDANEGWAFEEALGNLEWLAEMGVELVEQPLREGELDATRELARQSPLPLFADEDVHRAEDIPRLAGVYHGINIKLAKCGGPSEALAMIQVARAHGLQVMLGCMIESSLGITAAAQLAPLVDFLDLDGHLLVTDDPFVGVGFASGRLVLPEAPGLGVRPRAEAEGR
ncbi:MAG: dipeptide epimerase [Thermoanaerobaculia bacterium]